MTTHIFIARHGQTEYNRLARIQGRGVDQPLNNRGRRQARLLGEYLQEENIDYVFSSSLQRSVETAQIIAHILQLPLNSYPELDEMDFGVIEGKPMEKIKPELRKLHEHWKSGDTSFALPGGESPQAVLKRILNKLKMIKEEHEGQNLLFVLHGRLIRILLSHWLMDELAEMHQIGHKNGALNHLRLKKNHKIEAVFLNKTDHLKELEIQDI